MNNIIGWFVAGMAGMALGVVFFVGLWGTVRLSVSSPYPGLLIFISLFLRVGIALVGFYLVAGGRWYPLLACLLGFVVARVMIIRFIAPWLDHYTARHHDMVLEINHEH